MGRITSNVSFQKKFLIKIIKSFVLPILIITICFAEGEDEMLSKKVSLFKVENKSPLEVVRKLVADQKILINIEAVPLESGVSEERLISIKQENKTIREILDFLIKEDSRYIWEKTNGSINIFPIITKENSDYFMNQKIHHFEVQNVTKWEAASTLFGVPELKRRHIYIMLVRRSGLRTPGNSKHEKRFSISMENANVREILNKIVETESNSYWILSGVVDYPNLSFAEMVKQEIGKKIE